MKNVGKLFLLSILILWEAPQNLLGLIIFIYWFMFRKIKLIETERLCLFVQTTDKGVSLGRFVFWTPTANRFSHLKDDCKLHEYGHSIQSIIFGPLYLIVIGIPSVMRVWYSWYYYKRNAIPWNNYYKAFPEDWADKLGNVVEKNKSSRKN